MTALYLPVLLWVLHQLCGTTKGNALYVQFAPIIMAAMTPAPALPAEVL